MRLLISNATVVTMNDHDDILEDAALVIDGQWIRYVGPGHLAPPGPYDRTLDAGRMVCVPGLAPVSGRTNGVREGKECGC